MTRLVVATNNAGKLDELRTLLGDRVELLTLDDAGLPSPDETGSTFQENALIKARAAAGGGVGSIADDSGLVVDALAGRPGVWSSRFSGESATDEENNDLLLSTLAGVPDERRTARFVSVVAYVAPDGREVTACGTVEGRIGRALRGTGGFGYDPLFLIDDPDAVEFRDRTMAELSLSEKNGISHRGRAYRALLRALDDAGLSFETAGCQPGVSERS